MAASSVTYLYDLALRTLCYTRFGSILGISSLAPLQSDAINKGVVICPKGIAQRMVAEKRGETFLEFINIYPSRFAFSWKRNRTVVSRRGLQYIKDDNTFGIIKADPFDLEYNLWFWTISLDKARLCMEKYIQWQHEAPKISLTYGDDFVLNPDLRFNSVVDESHIEDIYNTGKIWVYRMPVFIEAWIPKLQAEDEKRIHKIHLTMYDKDDVTSSYSTVAVADSNQDVELAAALKMFETNLYGIIEVVPATKIFKVQKNRSAEFTVGLKIIVENSTANDNDYTVVSSTYSAVNDETSIVVLETISDNTADGNIYIHKEPS